FGCVTIIATAAKQKCAAMARVVLTVSSRKSQMQVKKFRLRRPPGSLPHNFMASLTLNMSEPTDLRLNVRVSGGYENKTIHFVNTGVPHVVIPAVNIEEIDVLREGAALRRHEMFSPKGANINFLEKCGGNKIAIRTYEQVA